MIQVAQAVIRFSLSANHYSGLNAASIPYAPGLDAYPSTSWSRRATWSSSWLPAYWRCCAFPVKGGKG